MALRTLYLQRSLSINERHCLSGRVLYDHLKAYSEEALLGYTILDKNDISVSTNLMFKDDFINYNLLIQLAPNLIFLEGGLFKDNEGGWRIPHTIVKEFVNDGSIMIIADADCNNMRVHKKDYQSAFPFIRASADYGPYDDENPIQGIDTTSNFDSVYQIVCKTEKMIISDWLSPVYDDISEILVGLPVKLGYLQDIVATGNKDTTGTIHNDIWIDEKFYCPFASVAKIGLGYVVFIAGHVTSDYCLERCPDNTRWLTNLAQFLRDDALKNQNRSKSHLKSPSKLFLSHRSLDKYIVEQIAEYVKKEGIGIWFDKERLVPSDSLVAHINRGLEQMSHFVLFWSINCLDSTWVERELNVGINMLIEKEIPLLIIRLDNTKVPSIISDIYRIEAIDKTPTEIGQEIVSAVYALSKR